MVTNTPTKYTVCFFSLIDLLWCSPFRFDVFSLTGFGKQDEEGLMAAAKRSKWCIGNTSSRVRENSKRACPEQT